MNEHEDQRLLFEAHTVAHTYLFVMLGITYTCIHIHTMQGAKSGTLPRGAYALISTAIPTLRYTYMSSRRIVWSIFSSGKADHMLGPPPHHPGTP